MKTSVPCPRCGNDNRESYNAGDPKVPFLRDGWTFVRWECGHFTAVTQPSMQGAKEAQRTWRLGK